MFDLNGAMERFAGKLALENILAAVITLLVCMVAVRLLLKLARRLLRRTKLEERIRRYILMALKLLLYTLTVVFTAGSLGINMTSLVALLSVGSLGVTLAAEDVLGNVAGGLVILSSHPFTIGDFIESGGVSGTVEEIGLFYTKLTTPDNKLVQMPNSSIVTANITNFSAHPTRRVELKVSAAYDAPTAQVTALLAQMAQEHPLVLAEPEPAVHVEQYGDSAICYVMRVWCANADYWTVYYDLMDGFKAAFDAAGIEMTYPHLNIHLGEGAYADPDALGRGDKKRAAGPSDKSVRRNDG